MWFVQAGSLRYLSCLRKIGIYGGTFDPVHCAHLILAREALEQLELEAVLFVPAAVSPHKAGKEAAPAAIRTEMLRAAIAGEERFCVSEIELQRPPPSFTIDTIQELRRTHAGAQLFYFIGSDQLAKLNTWHRIGDMREGVEFVVLARGEEAVPKEFRAIHRLIEISSTEIRNRVATGRSIRYLVPPAVEEIIQRQRLYQETTRSLPKS